MVPSDFYKFLTDCGALRVGSDFTLKSKRKSPYFVNIGDFCSGDTIEKLGEAYATCIQGEYGEDIPKTEPLVIFGPSYKGSAIAIATATALTKLYGRSVKYCYDRKEAKLHGEMSAADASKTMLVGAQITNKTPIIIVDDVMTTAETKYEALKLLHKCGAAPENILGIVIAVNRQEVAIDGKDAVEEFVKATGVPVHAILCAEDIMSFLENDGKKTEALAIRRYLCVYGNSGMEMRLPSNRRHRVIPGPIRGLVPACDVSSLDELEVLVKALRDEDCVVGYKIGFQLGLTYGLPKVCERIRSAQPKAHIIYDHQKAGTDIPDTGAAFMKVCQSAGVDTVILFPQSGPEVERAWLYEAFRAGLNVMVGGRMTHPAYAVSEGGFITDEGAMEIYRIAVEAGVRDFVVPGNKPDVIAAVKDMVSGVGLATFWAPGFVSQGGKLEAAAEIAKPCFKAIVGRALTDPLKDFVSGKKSRELVMGEIIAVAQSMKSAFE